MTLFLRDVGNYIIHFIFMFVVFCYWIGYHSDVGRDWRVGLVLHFALGSDRSFQIRLLP